MTVTNCWQVQKLNNFKAKHFYHFGIKVPCCVYVVLKYFISKFEIVHVVLKFYITLLKVWDYYEMCLLKIPQFT